MSQCAAVEGPLVRREGQQRQQRLAVAPAGRLESAQPRNAPDGAAQLLCQTLEMVLGLRHRAAQQSPANSKTRVPPPSACGGKMQQAAALQ